MLRSAALFAGVVLILSGGAKLLERFDLLGGEEFSHRMVRALTGLVLAYIGNSIPKTLTPLDRLCCDPARVQAFQRWSGWIWLLAGVGYAIVWLVAPLDLATPISMAVLVIAIALGLTLLIWLRRSGQSAA
jgi:hypothetical protein